MMSLNVLHEKGPLMPFTQDLIGVFVQSLGDCGSFTGDSGPA